MSHELVLIASVILGVFLVPSLITVRPTYIREDRSSSSPSFGGQPTE
jgi:uncharacterized membrane protein